MLRCDIVKMKQLRFALQIGAATIVLLLIPGLLLKAAGLGVSKLLLISVALAMALIPIEIVILVVYFNTAGVQAFLNGMQLHSRANIIEAVLIVPLGDLLMGYALITAIKSFWLG